MNFVSTEEIYLTMNKQKYQKTMTKTFNSPFQLEMGRNAVQPKGIGRGLDVVEVEEVRP